MKLDREMEMLLKEIPLLHHGDLLGRREPAADADDDLPYLIQELAAMGVVDEEEETLPSPVAADELGFSGFICPKKASSSPTSNLHFLNPENFATSRPFSMNHHCANVPSSLVDPFPFYSASLNAAAVDGWDFQCSAAARARCKSARRKASPIFATSPKKCAAKPAKYESLAGLRRFMYHIARDQHGCRFLQQRLDDGKREVDFIFAGVARHAVELMVNLFGNYLMQKLLAVCDDEQRMGLVLILTKEIQLVIEALRPGFLELIKDPNGNHVVQKCLQSFEADDNKPIFEAAAVHCLDIGMQCHGCCVLQRCIACSTGEHREKLVQPFWA